LQICPPQWIDWLQFDLKVQNLPAALHGVRITHLSDFHLRKSWHAGYEFIAAQLKADPPDLLLLTGDFVDSKRNPYPALPQVRRLLAALPRSCPTFAIVGNHDDYAVAYELRHLGIPFLDGKLTTASVKGASIELIGFPGARRFELERAFLQRLPKKQQDVPRIILSHFPDHLRHADGLDADLLLAGHTHGGQMCLPGGIPLMWHDSLPRRLSRGVHQVNGTWLVVSRGLGHTGLPFRVFCPPEVIELRLIAG
jgi:predicted MPP superfamily phosphohydrolase